MGAEFELQGLDELLNQLQQISDKAGRTENKALKAAAQPVADEMKSLVNVSTIDHLHIRDNIQISGIKSKGGIKYVEIGPGKETNWRAKFLEWGTSKMQAKPFVQISYEHKKNEVLEIIKQTIAEALE